MKRKHEENGMSVDELKKLVQEYEGIIENQVYKIKLLEEEIQKMKKIKKKGKFFYFTQENIFNLSTDIFYYCVFPFLNQNDTLKLERVCKNFQSIVYDCTKHIFVNTVLFKDIPMRALIKYKSLKSLDLTQYQVNNKSLEYLRDLNSLESLKIISLKNHSNEILEFFSDMKDLKSLCLKGFWNNFQFLFKLKKLEYLNLDGCIGFIESEVFKTPFPNIKTLLINNIPPKDQSPIFSSFQNLKHFEYLSGSFHGIKINGLKKISKMVDLEYLSISLSNSKQTFTCDFLKNLKKLKYLKLTGVDTTMFKGNENLEFFDFHIDIYNVNLTFDPVFLSESQNLKTLNIRTFDKFDLKVVESLKIENLSLIHSNHTNFTFDDVNLLKNLKDLYIDTIYFTLKNVSLQRLTINYLNKKSEISGTVNELILKSPGSFEPIKSLIIKNKLELIDFQEDLYPFDKEILKDREIKYFYVGNNFSQITLLDLIESFPNIKFIKN